MTDGERAGVGRRGEGHARHQALWVIRDEEEGEVGFPGFPALSWLPVFLLPGPGWCLGEKRQERETRAPLSLGEALQEL